MTSRRPVGRAGIALLVLAAGLSGAGAARAVPLDAGLHAGVDVATMNLDGPTSGALETAHRVGPTAGAWVAWRVSPAFAFETGIDWRSKGARTRDEVPYLFPGGDGRARLVWDHRYLEVPLRIRWTLPRTGSVRVELATGPAFAFPVAAEVRPEGDDDAAVDEMDALATVDVGVQAGVAVVFDRLRVDARYTHGTDDVYDDDRLDGGRNRAVAMTLGWIVWQ